MRFIDLRDHNIAPYRFAFWDGVRETFCSVNHEQAWPHFDDFAAALDEAGGHYTCGTERLKLEDFRALCPEWSLPSPTNE